MIKKNIHAENGYPQRKTKLFPMEKVTTFEPYTFNLSPAGDTFIQQRDKGYAMAQHLRKLVNFVLYPEIGGNGRLHWHGFITFTSYVNIVKAYNIINSYKDDYIIEIDSISDHATWYTYITKQRHIMEPYLGSLKMPYILANWSFDDKSEKYHVNVRDAFKSDLDYEPVKMYQHKY